MFSFLRRRPADFGGTIRQAVVNDGRQANLDPETLAVVQRRGSYSGRSVQYFRVFDPTAAATGGLHPRRYEDLDGHPELVVGAGHIEHGGAVVLTPRSTTRSTPLPDRLLARRESHSDDESVVFPKGGTS
jgi:hypothetical protein